MKDYALLIALPLSIIFIYSLISVYQNSGTSKSFLQSVGSSVKEANQFCLCNKKDNEDAVDYCYNTTVPVMGGVDMVQYFTAFKLPDGTYNESEVGQQGSDKYSSTYNNYIYHFVSKTNLRLFEANPTAYIPQWGGFCSWGMSREVCPTWDPDKWSATCLGPSGNWATWTIINEKLYFFLKALPKSYFLNETDYNIAAGDKRWARWYPDASDAKFATNCVVVA